MTICGSSIFEMAQTLSRSYVPVGIKVRYRANLRVMQSTAPEALCKAESVAITVALRVQLQNRS